jgi:hypothetical protein
MKKTIVLVFAFVFLMPVLALAKIGVGVGTGKIVMEQALKPGLTYTPPPLMVINTGNEPADYGVSVGYRENQPEMKPPSEWFSLEPSEFRLEPNQVQAVQIKINLPVKGAVPGDYFAFLEGHPLNKVQSGATTIGVAAAAKLYFKVAPANIWQALYYKYSYWFKAHSPWSLVVFWVIVAAAVVLILRRFFTFNIGIGRKQQ